MAQMVVKEREYKHKKPAKRGTLSRTRVTNNGKKVDLHKLVARRTLKVRK